jgi:hypothetical protein
MKRIKLRVKKDIKYETIKSCVDHKSQLIAASIKLNLSKRQIFRLINVYKKRGKEGFIHGNRDRKPINTLNKTLSTKIIQLVNKKYKDNNSNYLILNYSHSQDMLKEKHNISISYASLYTLMLKNNFLSPKIQKIQREKLLKKNFLLKNQTQNLKISK